MTAVLLATWLTVVVDQLDGDVASVEWAPHIFGTVDVDVLPDDVREGDRIDVRVRRRDLRVAGAAHGAVTLTAQVRSARHSTLSTRTALLSNTRREP